SFLPSRRTTLVVITHLLPSLVQEFSPKPPSASNIQERMFFAIGSQPIQSVAAPTGTSFTSVEKLATIKFWVSVQLNDNFSLCPFSPSLAQSPMAHSRALKARDLKAEHTPHPGRYSAATARFS